jgi:hypothetical protein
MWTPEESVRIVHIARKIVTGIKTYSLPQGFQKEHGPDAVVELLLTQMPKMLD